MNAGEHLTVGIIVGIATAAALYLFSHFDLNINNFIITLIIAALYCILPDIDHKSGTITWLFIGTSALLIVLGVLGIDIAFIGRAKNVLLLGIILLVSTFSLAQFAGHRGFVHTIWFGAICAAGLFFITGEWQHCVIAFSAFYSHLAADGLWLKV
jgi:membrane-bound metal-dependent hydrolase YbcI (DUF457 family)